MEILQCGNLMREMLAQAHFLVSPRKQTLIEGQLNTQSSVNCVCTYVRINMKSHTQMAVCIQVHSHRQALN